VLELKPVLKVTELLTVKVLLLAIVKVAADAGAVIANLLIDVAVAAPNIGVVKVGETLNTKLPVPVEPVDVTPSRVGWPVSVKLLKIGDELNTKLPVPVEPVEVTPSRVG
jgi:hypothetical protein